MTQTVTVCGRCDRPSNTHLCPTCQTNTRDLLSQVAWLDDQLHTRAYGGTEYNVLEERALWSGKPATEDDETSPVPFDERASAARRYLRSVLEGETLRHAKRNKITLDPSPRATAGDYATYLATVIRDIARAEGSPQFADDLAWAHSHGVEQINRRVSPVYLGPCPAPVIDSVDGDTSKCGENLWTSRDVDGRPPRQVQCWRCREIHDVAEIQASAADKAEAMLMTGAETLRVLAAIGERVPRVTFYAWRKRNDIEVRGYRHRDGRITDTATPGANPVFLFGDARLLARQHRETPSKS